VKCAPWILPLLALLLLPTRAPAQTLTRAPELVHFEPAAYPPEAEAAGIEGSVLLEIDVGPEGAVLDARVIAPAGHGFDEAAVEAVRRFRFSPAEIDGQPAAVTIEYRYDFRIRQVATEPPPEAEAPVNLRGRLLTRGSKRPIAGATVDVNDGQAVAVSGEDGSFEVRGVPVGQARVVVVDVRHERYETTETIEEGRVTEVVYYVHPKPTSPFEQVVIGKADRKEVSTVAISVGELTRLPGTSGDTVKVVQNLPGVARAPYGAGVLVIRGGNPNDTRTYVDGQEVPLIFHFGALTSVYASELVEEVQFEPGNFGARYGRAIGGRVELVTRAPREERLHLVADADLFDATALVETPVSENLSMAVAARRSYVDAVINAAASAAPDAFGDLGFAIAPRYYDYQAKLRYRASEDDDLRLDVYGSDDALSVVGVDAGGVEDTNAASTRTRFFRVGLTWDHRLDASTRARVQVTPGWDHLNVHFDPLLFDVRQTTANTRAELFHDVSEGFSIGGGLDLAIGEQRVSTQLPRPTPPGQLPAPDFRQDLVDATFDHTYVAPGLWVEAIWQPIEALKLVPGLRFDYDSFIDSSWVDPRFATRLTLDEATVLKGAVGLYHQPPLPQYATAEFGNPDVHEEGAVQYMIGVERRIHGPLGLDVQLFYKDLFDAIAPTDEVVVRNGEEIPLRYDNDGTGRSYGAELLLRYDPDGRFFGWIAYTFSRVQYDAGRATSRTGGADQYDQPHNLVALGTLELPEIWDGLSVGFRARYTSGAPRWRVAGGVYDADADDTRALPDERSSDDRLPDFFQLDLRVDKRWTFDTATFTAYVDVQNVTNRTNAEGMDYNHDFTRSRYQPGLPIFPSFGLRWEY